MASYGYQYGTSARKLEPEVRTPKKSSNKTKNTKKVNNKSKQIKSKNNQDKIKAKEAKLARTNFAIIMVIALGCVLLLMYRNVKIRESFAGVQALNKSVALLEKENSQIAVNIQNNLNLSNIENIATSTLGMQKLSSGQTIYINLDVKNYTELNSKNTKSEEITFGQKIINKIIDLF